MLNVSIQAIVTYDITLNIYSYASFLLLLWAYILPDDLVVHLEYFIQYDMSLRHPIFYEFLHMNIHVTCCDHFISRFVQLLCLVTPLLGNSLEVYTFTIAVDQMLEPYTSVKVSTHQSKGYAQNRSSKLW